MSASKAPTEVIAPSSLHTRVNEALARVVVADGPDRGQVVELGKGAIRVGTDHDCELVLTDPTVSGEHLEVTREGEYARFVDLASTNGSYYGQARLGQVLIRFGDEVRLGRTVLRYVPVEEAVPVSASEDEAFGELLGRDVRMREVFSLLAELAPTRATVIVEGETGTGKELVAAAIHRHSDRADGPFVVFDCSAVPKDLLDSALFGHMKGSFTGATQTRIGAFERAHGGTIFLDEIGELDLALQPKLLRVLESREVQRVGGDEYAPVDVRVIVATNRSLKALMRQKIFRNDLYYRLAVIKICLPPLRERRDDVELLARSFLTGFGAAQDLIEATLNDRNLRHLVAHDWPGNVRELRNVMERVCHLGKAASLDLAKFLIDPDLDDDVVTDPGVVSARGLAAAAAIGKDGSPIGFKAAKQSMVEAFEREYLQDLLQRSGGNISGASREAGIDRKHFKELMKKYGLVPAT